MEAKLIVIGGKANKSEVKLKLLEDEGLVEVDTQEGRRTFRLTEAGRTYVEAHKAELGAPWWHIAAVAFGVFGIPETFFIDPEGTVVGRIIGPTDALTLGGAIDAIRRGEDPGEKRLGNTRSGPGDA